MGAVAIRELKNRLSEYLRRVKTGERLVVTERGRPVAVISRVGSPADEGVEAMVRERAARWGGGKPRGATRPPKIKGPSAARAVLEGKIGTALNEDILNRARVRAAQESRNLSELLVDALRAYLSRHSATSGPQLELVDKSWGVFRVTPKQLKEALKGEIFEP